MKRSPSLKFVYCLLLVLVLLFFFTFDLKANTADRELPAESPLASPALSNTSEHSWTFLEKLQEAKDLVASASLDLKVGNKDFIYYERRISVNSRGLPSVTKKKMTDPEREIALVLADIKTGELELIKITERGNDLTVPRGYEIKNFERVNGITNNAWNTCRQVIAPENKIIILNVWPRHVTIKVPRVVKSKGKSKTVYDTKKIVENVVYSPYCEELNIPEFINSGRDYRKSIVHKAREILAERGVRSKAFPDKLITEVVYLKPQFFERLPLVEHMDYGEFKDNSQKSAERVDVILGTNLNQAYNLTCSRAAACGWMQYTKTTWNSMRKKYPLADLPVFEAGVKDHVMSMVGAILLHDSNLKASMDQFGLGILSDLDQLEEMLAANYNGGTVRPFRSLRASILKNLEDWVTDYLRPETRQYIEKVRYLRSNY